MPNTTYTLTMAVPAVFLDEMNKFIGKPGKIYPSQQDRTYDPWYPRYTWAISRKKRAEIHDRAICLAAEMRARMETVQVHVPPHGGVAKILEEVAGRPGKLVRGDFFTFRVPRDRVQAFTDLATLLRVGAIDTSSTSV